MAPECADFFSRTKAVSCLFFRTTSGNACELSLGRRRGQRRAGLRLFHYKMSNANDLAGIAGGCHFDLPASDMKIGIDVL